MPNGQGSESTSTSPETVLVQTRARPWSGLFLGILLGVSLAIILQQAGVWPLDRLLVFGAAGIFGLIGILLTSWGREKGSGISSVVPLVLAFAMIAWGATGLTQLNETGELNGGCTVEAQSDVDTTIMTDTTRQNPFEVDPEGGLSWHATSPSPITDHTWQIWVDLGGFQVVVAEGSDSNAAENLENAGDVPDISVYIEEVTEISGEQIRGVVEVGGDIEGDGGACDGFAFVRLTADPFATLASQIAAALALIALISLITIAMRRTRTAEVMPEDVMTSQAATSSRDTALGEGPVDTAQTDVVTQPEDGAAGAPKPGDGELEGEEPTSGEPKEEEGFPPTT